ncbi:MAG: hypothetical protein KDA28_04175, partial [Phycisphaerales bacterium]|nr:hypothetical protein [Phycisphaerales bacterium]
VDGAIRLALSWTALESTLPVVYELAARHGVLVLDAQAGHVAFPREDLTRGALQMEDGTHIVSPTPEVLESALRSLDGQNSFAILARESMSYMQTASHDDGTFALEYQEGSLDEHFETAACSLDDVIRAFQSYARDDDAWRTAFPWVRMEL